MYIVQRVVENHHGGSLMIASEPGKNVLYDYATVFLLFFKLAIFLNLLVFSKCHRQAKAAALNHSQCVNRSIETKAYIQKAR